MKKYILTFILLLSLIITSCVQDTPGEDGTKQIITVPSDITQSTQTGSASDTAVSTDDSGTVKPVDTSISSDTSKNPETTDAPQTGDTVISFLACGDNIVHDAVIYNGTVYASGTNQEYNFLPIYKDIADIIKSADVAFINQETQIAGDAGKIGGYPNFNTPEQMGKDLISLGFDVISTANNHMLDNSTAGLKNSIAYWKKQSVLTVGSYSSQNDYDNIRVLEIDGVKIAFLAYTEMINHDNTASSPYITPLLNKNTIETQVAYAKTVADLVIVSAHWGDEDEFGVTSNQKKYMQIMANCGVDVVLGTHPHVIGGIEWITRSDGGKMLCAYSLGNLCSTMYYARNLVGIMLNFDIAVKNGDISIQNVSVIPTVTYFTYNQNDKRDERRENLKIYLLEDFTEELAASHAWNEKESTSFTLSKLRAFVTDNVAREFLPDYLK